MSDPALALQGAIIARLRAQVAALSNRVYDRAPQTVAFPYAEFGETQTLDDGAECIDGTEVYVTLHVWSRAIGAVEARTLSAAIRTAVKDWRPDLSAALYRCIDFQHRETRVLADPDDVTTHAVITLRAIVDAL